ncbi:hypothetical protein CTAM01_11281 [Colletotrichum tamarilloi]|uniref:Uncharacterized protein n=1 Tax=Colletotrichum tamarilloi TaxID=1209934 RepID=A0ABQ9QXZ0_9PEZI|nr:uncharacterized protein CTAM01_11281 [Colletotrichum tamarilloi]KAK1488957.1 hypothetical protein CTAM01_11281 [Colletotrichum tamarilloi]
MKGIFKALATAVLATASLAQESAPPSAPASASAGSPQPSSGALPAVAPIRLRLNPANVRNLVDSDFITWTIPGSSKANITVANITESDVTFTLAAGNGSELAGNYYK